jgi:hypothetical protein
MKRGFFPGTSAVRVESSERPNLQVVRFVNVGHLIYREQFAAFIALIRDFLAV